MSDPIDLEAVIEDSLNDAAQPAEPAEIEEVVVDTPTDDTPVDESAEQVEESIEISAPGTKPIEKAEGADDFAKKFGLQANSVTGRENRIPYSRVKKIVEKNEKDVTDRVTKEAEAKFTPQITEFQTKLKAYEDRQVNVQKFEEIMEGDPKTFLGMLSKLPAYKEFFEFVQKASDGIIEQPAKATDLVALMPQPDQTLTDGSKVYSMEGLQALLKWQEDQVAQKTIKQVEERYAPIEKAWQTQEHAAKMVPIIEKQIAEARTWDKFTELEPKVVEILNADKNITLERAYLKAYQDAAVAEREQLSTDRNKMRTELLAELKKKPVSSAAPTAPAKASKTPSGPQSVEDIIAASIAESGIKG